MKQGKGTVFFQKQPDIFFPPLKIQGSWFPSMLFKIHTERDNANSVHRQGLDLQRGVTTHCCIWKCCLQSRPSDVICLFLHVVSCLSPSPCAPLAPKQSHLLICKVIVPGCFLHISSSFQRCVCKEVTCLTNITCYSFILHSVVRQIGLNSANSLNTHAHTLTSAWATLAECLWQSILLTAAMLRYFYQHMNQQ